jgi:hypothetical protein
MSLAFFKESDLLAINTYMQLNEKRLPMFILIRIKN